MHQASICRLSALVVLAAALARSVSAQQSDASFTKAIGNRSTSPSYVLITVVNDNTGSRRTICTLATFLDGAIHSQYHLPYTEEGERKSKQIALSSKDRTYHFSEANALRNLRVHYSLETVAQIRKQLSGYTTEEIVSRLFRSRGGLHRIYARQKNFVRFSDYRDAMAFVLLERGVQVGQADMTGDLYQVK